MKKYFRETPPDGLILKALASVGLEGFTDSRFIYSTYLKKEIQDEVLAEIRNYYFPVFAKTYLDKSTFSFSDYITIIRQLLKTKGINLERRESRRRIDKNIYCFEGKYRIPPSDTIPEMTVTFN